MRDEDYGSERVGEVVDTGRDCRAARASSHPRNRRADGVGAKVKEKSETPDRPNTPEVSVQPAS